MNIYLDRGKKELIPADLLVSAILRTDLAPVPRTLELRLRVKDSLVSSLIEGKELVAGYEELPYTIVKAERIEPAQAPQGTDQQQVVMLTCLLTQCLGVASRSPRAIIRDAARIGEIYRACGATIPVDDEFVVSRFCCLKGGVPSESLARVMQEESAALVLRNGRLSVKRISELIAQKPRDVIKQVDPTTDIQSVFIESHEIPNFYTVGADGECLGGDMSRNRQVRFMPRSNARVLNSAGKALVVQKKLTSQLAQDIVAGDVIEVMGERFVVVTSANVFTQEEGVTETNTLFWLGRASL